MGKTPKPLGIAVASVVFRANEELWDKLAAQGHGVVELPPLFDTYDIVLGPNCWRMTPGLLQHLDLAITGARTLRYTSDKPSEKVETPVKRKRKGKADVEATPNPNPGLYDEHSPIT